MKNTILFFLLLCGLSVNAQERKVRTSNLGGDSTAMFTASSSLQRGGATRAAYQYNGKDYIVEESNGTITVWKIVRCYPNTYRLQGVGRPIPVSEGSRKSTTNYIIDALNDNE